MIMYVIKNGEKINVFKKEVVTSKRGSKTLKINDKFILTRKDEIIYKCDMTGKIFHNKFQLGDRFTGEKIYSTNEFKKLNSLKKYGVDNPAKNSEVKKKISETKINKEEKEKDDTNKKRIKTNLKKYGVESYNSLQEIKEKKKQTWLKKYNKDNPNKNIDIKNKIKNTKLEKYGNINYNNIKKIKETNLKKYGVENVFQVKEIIEKKKQTNKINFYNKLLDGDRLNNLSIPLFNRHDNTERETRYKWKCNKCETIFFDHLYSGNIPKCPVCYPKNRSKYEYEIERFLIEKSFYYQKNFKNKKYGIYPYELDFFLPHCNMAIEFNGLYWHSDKYKDKYYHQNKVKLCYDKNIRLLHIWEDEWIYDKNLIKGKILFYINNMNKDIVPKEPMLTEINGYKIWK